MMNVFRSAGFLRTVAVATLVSAGAAAIPASASAADAALEIMRKQSQSLSIKKGTKGVYAYKSQNGVQNGNLDSAGSSGDPKMSQWAEYWEQYRAEQKAAYEERMEKYRSASKPAAGSNASSKDMKSANASVKKSFGQLMEDYRKRYTLSIRPQGSAGKSAAAQDSAAASKGKRSSFDSIIARHASANGIPLSLAHAVVKVESAYRPNVRGSAGEIGLMQLKLSTARMMGYRGSAKGLYDPETNIKYGMLYLGKARQLAGGTTCGTILKYNAGHGAKRMNPVSSRYCSKVKRLI